MSIGLSKIGLEALNGVKTRPWRLSRALAESEGVKLGSRGVVVPV